MLFVHFCKGFIHFQNLSTAGPSDYTYNNNLCPVFSFAPVPVLPTSIINKSLSKTRDWNTKCFWEWSLDCPSS